MPPTQIVVVSATIIAVGVTLGVTETVVQTVSGEFVTQPTIEEAAITHTIEPSATGIGIPV